MPTDETTLGALAVRMEKSAEWHAATAKQYAEDTELSAMQARFAAEARLIADALRCKLASLTGRPEYFDIVGKATNPTLAELEEERDRAWAAFTKARGAYDSRVACGSPGDWEVHCEPI